jgi:enamine deaminase RidA (YjgF/YER057c/UK114 family)
LISPFFKSGFDRIAVNCNDEMTRLSNAQCMQSQVRRTIANCDNPETMKGNIARNSRGSMMSAEDRLRELGLVLPPVPRLVGKYIGAVQIGELLFVSGNGPVRADGSPVVGKIGGDLTPEQGYEAARLVALGMLANIRAHLGSLDRVVRFAKVVGRVNATPEFMGHAQVIDGYTDLMVWFSATAHCARDPLPAWDRHRFK